MFRALVLGVLTSLALVAQNETRSLGIFLKFENTPAPGALQAMQDEVSFILEPTGLTLHWRLLEENRGDESFSEIVVFRFLGNCKVQASIPRTNLHEMTLATTAVGVQGVQPFSEVACEKVSQLLSARLRSSTALDRQKLFGRVLGRVMVHELLHSLANVTMHSGRGILKSTHAARDLMRDSVRLDASETRLLQVRTSK